MLNLNSSSLKDAAQWEKIGVKAPSFDFDRMTEHTLENPSWLHFGAGNIFRGYIARLQHELLNKGKVDSGIVVAESFDFDIIDKIYAPHDCLTLLATMNHDGSVDKEIVASMAAAYRADVHRGKIEKMFTNPSLQMVSFTITEKGYALHSADGSLLPIVKADMANRPSETKHIMSLVTALLLIRFNMGAYPLSLVSMDNCSHNGDRLRDAVLAIATAWVKNGFASDEFISYLRTKIAFPWSMIDKITPRPSEAVQSHLENLGIAQMTPIVTSKNTYTAPFVNAEAAEYLVIEDAFPNGRPPLHDVGVYFTDRQTVNKVETMKVTTCLNPLHTALAVFGCLLGYTSIAEEMKDNDLVALVKKIGYDEGMKVVVDPVIISPKDFIDEVIERRLPNPFIPDAPQRIATDTSQKVGIRFGETIKAYMAHPELNTEDLIGIPLAIAAWMRYLLGVDDNLNSFELSPDPMMDTLQSSLKGIIPDQMFSYTGQLALILSNPNIFGVDLYEAKLGRKIENLFVEMLDGEGSVRRILSRSMA